MAKFILNIRPDAAAADDSKALNRRGVAAQGFPVMSLRQLASPHSTQHHSTQKRRETMPPDPMGITGLIFTSRHAVTYFANMVDMRAWADKPVYVVGATSARAAENAGFTHVVAGLGGGASLVPLIVAEQSSDNATLLWPSGVHKSFDMRIALAKSGHDVIDWPVYETVFADHFPDDIAAAIGRGDLLAIVTLSARTSEAFAALMRDAGLWHLRSNIIVIAGSKAIGDAAGAGWREVIVARAPKRSRILAIATLVYRRYLRDDAAPRKR